MAKAKKNTNKLQNKSQVTVKKKSPKKVVNQIRNIMYICRSCVWSEVEREIDGKRQGAVLLQNIKEMAEQKPLPESIDLRGVFCLNGCLKPCNVSFRARDKYTIRFSGLTTKNAEEILTVAKLYASSKDGNLKNKEIPKALKDRVSVRTPPLRY